MASLDVESLFTNIPLKETINNCVSDLHNKSFFTTGNSTNLSYSNVLETAVSEPLFNFDFLLYKKIDGVAMDYPLGSTLASAFLCHYEKEWLNILCSFFIQRASPAFWRLHQYTA